MELRRYAERYAEEGGSLFEGLRATLTEAEKQGLDELMLWKTGNLAMPRLQELAAAINRMRDVHWE